MRSTWDSSLETSSSGAYRRVRGLPSNKAKKTLAPHPPPLRVLARRRCAMCNNPQHCDGAGEAASLPTRQTTSRRVHYGGPAAEPRLLLCRRFGRGRDAGNVSTVRHHRVLPSFAERSKPGLRLRQVLAPSRGAHSTGRLRICPPPPPPFPRCTQFLSARVAGRLSYLYFFQILPFIGTMRLSARCRRLAIERLRSSTGSTLRASAASRMPTSARALPPPTAPSTCPCRRAGTGSH